MKPTRPFRAHEVYASPCVDCGAEIESPTLPVPLRCGGCQHTHNLTDPGIQNKEKTPIP